MGDRVHEIAERMTANGQDECVVLNEHGIVMGRTRRNALLSPGPSSAVDDIMEIGPSTVRPDEPLQELVDRMSQRGVRSTIVTTLEGKLIGVLYREEAEALLGINASPIDANEDQSEGR